MGLFSLEIRMSDQLMPTDIDTIRREARQHLEQGAVTAGYCADRSEVLAQLNAALACCRRPKFDSLNSKVPMQI